MQDYFGRNGLCRRGIGSRLKVDMRGFAPPYPPPYDVLHLACCK